MKIPRRIVTVSIALAVAAALTLVLTLRSFAQPGPHDINIPGWQKLKAPYDEDGDAWETKILKKHSKKYCVTHRKKSNHQETQHCPKAQAEASQSMIIPVADTSSPASGSLGDTRPAVNVTQKIPCETAADQQAIMATFDTSP